MSKLGAGAREAGGREEGRSAGVKLLQGGQDDHGEAAAASHCLQLQQEGLRGLRTADVKARLQHM